MKTFLGREATHPLPIIVGYNIKSANSNLKSEKSKFVMFFEKVCLNIASKMLKHFAHLSFSAVHRYTLTVAIEERIFETAC